MKTLLTIEQLSTYIHKTVSSIRSDVSRNPKALPPICRLPHTKRLLWRREDVDNWIAQHVETDIAPLPQTQTAPRRGRPTKAEQIARERQQKMLKSGSALTQAQG